MDEDTIRIVTDDAPQILAPDGSKMGLEDLGPYYFHDDEAPRQKGKDTGGVGVHNVKVQKLEEEMGHLMQVVERLFNRTQQQGNRKPGMQLDEIELSVEINGEGQISILGNGGKAGGKGAIKLKFKRAD
ncbi:MAG TPA: hypothetical protein V6C85_21660 [Allocoleopsis sp.]